MAMPNNSMGGADDDLYSDGMGGDVAPKKDMDKGKDDARDSEEAILPRSICPNMDLAVGDKIELEVTAIHDKEISVKYSEPEDDKDEKGEDMGADQDGGKAPMPAGMAAGGNDMYD